MAAIITILSLLKEAANLTKKVSRNADLDMFIHEIDSALNSPAGIKLRVDSIRERINEVIDKLSSVEQQTLQNNVTQSFSSNGISVPFDENGYLKVNFSDFLSQSLNVTDIDSLPEPVDVPGPISDVPGPISDLPGPISDLPVVVTDLTEGSDSIWEILSNLFD